MTIVMLGAGGHARSVADALGSHRVDVVVVPRPGFEDTEAIAKRAMSEAQLLEGEIADPQLVNGVGQTKPYGRRWELYRRLSDEGFEFLSVMHPTAQISTSVEHGLAVQLLAGSIVGPHVSIGDNALVNTGAIVEHDCTIGPGVHVASGAVLCGGVTVGAGAMIGAGATVLPGRCVAAGATVGAGAVVIRDVESDQVVVGSPARVVRSHH